MLFSISFIGASVSNAKLRDIIENQQLNKFYPESEAGTQLFSRQAHGIVFDVSLAMIPYSAAINRS